MRIREAVSSSLLAATIWGSAFALPPDVVERFGDPLTDPIGDILVTTNMELGPTLLGLREDGAVIQILRGGDTEILTPGDMLGPGTVYEGFSGMPVFVRERFSDLAGEQGAVLRVEVADTATSATRDAIVLIGRDISGTLEEPRIIIDGNDSLLGMDQDILLTDKMFRSFSLATDNQSYILGFAKPAGMAPTAANSTAFILCVDAAFDTFQIIPFDAGVVPPAGAFGENWGNRGEFGEWNVACSESEEQLFLTFPAMDAGAVYSAGLNLQPTTVLATVEITVIGTAENPLPMAALDRYRETARTNTVAVGTDCTTSMASELGITTIDQFDMFSETHFIATGGSPCDLQQRPFIGLGTRAIDNDAASTVPLGKGDIDNDGDIDDEDVLLFTAVQRGEDTDPDHIERSDFDDDGDVDDEDREEFVKRKLRFDLTGMRDIDPDFTNPGIFFIDLIQGDPVPGFADRTFFTPFLIKADGRGNAVFVSRAFGPGGFLDQIEVLWTYDIVRGYRVIATTLDDFGDGAFDMFGSFVALSTIDDQNQAYLVTELADGRTAIYVIQVAETPPVEVDSSALRLR